MLEFLFGRQGGRLAALHLAHGCDLRFKLLHARLQIGNVVLISIAVFGSHLADQLALLLRAHRDSAGLCIEPHIAGFRAFQPVAPVFLCQGAGGKKSCAKQGSYRQTMRGTCHSAQHYSLSFQSILIIWDVCDKNRMPHTLISEDFPFRAFSSKSVKRLCGEISPLD
ncbi:Hypothetical protein, conserved [Brucella suis ATCC 23445]|uniref:Uncharacterized protein n=1 Tax=Brucella suis (strain ATCC 23445 / NCTC 10510) TaxID=470137 RepID=B0CJU2_BRUSI|nr:Hypothetical protein, conserved [Brucella suis ATCC 23445]